LPAAQTLVGTPHHTSIQAFQNGEEPMTLNSRKSGASSGKSQLQSMGPWAAILGGGALAAYGLSRKSLGGAALAAVGAYGAVLGAKRGTMSPTTIHVQRTFTIDRPPQELYAYWHNFENLPRFMKHLKSVTTKDGRTSHWVAEGPMGIPVEWDAEVVDERPNEFLVWRSLPGAAVSNRGSVEFRPAPNWSGTEVAVALVYSNPAGKMGAAFAKMFGREPEQQIREDLRRFKELMETGEIATVVGQPSGRRSTVVGAMHAVKQPETTQRVRKGPARQTRPAQFQPQLTGTESGGGR
jgi:uncharacterized membrane protein